MTSIVSETSRPVGRSRLGAVVLAGLAGGLVDFVYASVVFGLAKGKPIYKVWQGPASGWLGKQAADGGYASAALGVATHFGIALCMAAAYGLEGGAVYAVSAALRDAIADEGRATLLLDLRPDLSAEALARRLAKAPAGQSTANILRKAGLSPLEIGLLREGHGLDLAADPATMAARIKTLPIVLTAPQPLDRAISTAGGVALSAVDDGLMLKALPGVYAAGEMLDWEAPTGGYLLQACFATGAAAARTVLARAGRG